MNRSFIIIMIPAVFVAAMYVSLGIYPPLRVWIGIGIFAVGFGVYRVRAMMIKRGNPEISGRPASQPAAPTALPGAPQK